MTENNLFFLFYRIRKSLKKNRFYFAKKKIFFSSLQFYHTIPYKRRHKAKIKNGKQIETKKKTNIYQINCFLWNSTWILFLLVSRVTRLALHALFVFFSALNQNPIYEVEFSFIFLIFEKKELFNNRSKIHLNK